MQPVHCSLRTEPWGPPSAALKPSNSSRQLVFLACGFSSSGLPKARLGTFWTALKLFSAAGRPASSLPMGFRQRRWAFWPGFKPFPAPLAYSCIAALPASGGSLGREPLPPCTAADLWNLPPRPAPLFFRVLQAPSNPSRHLWPSPATQPCAAPVCPVVTWLPADWSILYFFLSRLRSCTCHVFFGHGFPAGVLCWHRTRPNNCDDQTTVWHAGHVCGCCC